MISILSNTITVYLLNKNAITWKDKELYDYGIFMIISYIVFLIISILFGLVFHIPFSSIIFYVVFCLLRNFAGGIHARSEIKCNILTTISLFLSILTIKLFIEHNLILVAFGLEIISLISLSLIQPVESSKKKITKQEKIFYHKKLVLMAIILIIISIIFAILNIYNIAMSISMSIVLANILLIIGAVKHSTRSF